MKFWNILKKYIYVYFFLVIFFYLSLVFVCSLPDGRIKNNIKNSIPLLESEGDYPIIGGEQKIYQLDNYTDCYMLNIIYSVDNTNPFLAALKSVYFSKNLPGNNQNLKIKLLKSLVENNKFGNKLYPRYWHGYMVYIRPLLMISTYSDIRKLYQLVFFILIAIITSLLYKKISIAVSVAFTISLALINFIIIPFSLQFSSVFFVAFIFMIVFLLFSNINFEKSIIIFFIIGAFTSFVDFLTTPLVTFGLPAITLILIRNHNQQKSILQDELLFLFLIGISWCFGYTILWSTKWLLASIVLQENILVDGSQAVLARAGGVIPTWLNDGTPLIFHALKSNWYYLTNHSKPIRWIFLYLIPGIFLIIFIIGHRKYNEFKLPFLLLIIAIMPYFWFIIASNHSAIHGWFTYRIQVISVMAVLCSMFYSIDWKKLLYN